MGPPSLDLDISREKMRHAETAIANQIAAFGHYSGRESLGALRDLEALLMVRYKLGQIHDLSIAEAIECVR